MSAFMFMIASLSAWRFTHLVVEDQLPLVAKPRKWLVARKPDSNMAYLVNCTWCSSVWVAAAHTWALDWLYSVPAPVFVVAALSVLTAAYETIIEWFDAKIIGGGN